MLETIAVLAAFVAGHFMGERRARRRVRADLARMGFTIRRAMRPAAAE